ncbi:MAG: DUF2723 domain-containing protein [candidate division WOR-3 bacterium]|jgi:hypothetical protein|nr:DUF2723 domain-containing protein [candidate division WOR-3 bacterium]MDH7518506.1 DUF2723 domain-containing protein [bacterium]
MTPKKQNRAEFVFFLAVPAVFCVYLLTRAPTVGLIDSGELAAGCYLLNILHPTGYPMWTLLGRIASLFPLGTVVNRVALLSAFFSAVGVAFFIVLLKQLGCGSSVSAAMGSILGFSIPVWSISTDVEVYSFSLALIIVVWWAVATSDSRKNFLLFAYLAGFTLTNHMFGLSAVLGASFVLILREKRRLLNRLPLMLLLFLLGLSPYLFLILRARCEPVLAWGNPVDLERLWWHITGKQYRVWMFSSSLNEVLRNAGKGMSLLAGGLGYVLLPFSVYGGLRLFRDLKAVALGLTVSAVISFLYAVNYSIPDIEAYFIPSLVCLLIFAAVGVEGIKGSGRKFRHLVWLVALGALALNFPAQNRADDWVAYDQALNTLAAVDSNATIITDWWDLYAPIFYLQQVEGVRTDVCIIDKELVRRSWYFEYLKRSYPWLMERSRLEKERFLEHLHRFEHNQPYSPVAIQESYISLLRSFFLKSPERPWYTTFPETENEDARQLLSGFKLVPLGIVYQVREDTLVPAFDYHRLRVRLPKRRLDERTQVNLNRYRYFVKQRIDLLMSQGRREEAAAVADWYQQNFLQR